MTIVATIAVVVYVIGVGYVAVETLPLAEESGAGKAIAILAGVLWPLMLTVGLIWALVEHIGDLIRGES